MVGILYDEEYTVDSNISYSNNNLVNNYENKLLRRPSNGTLLFQLESWGKITRVYENGYSKPRKFIDYVSPVWAKRSQYTESLNRNISWSRSSNISLDIADKVKTQYGLSTSASTGVGIGSVIPADPNRNSKLALYADFHDYYLKCVVTNAKQTEIYDTYYGDVLFPTTDFYYVVEYQK